MSSRAFARPGRTRTKARRKDGLGEFVRFLLLLFVCAVLLRSFVFAPFNIPSGSMLPRLMIGDYLFVAKWPYGYSRHALPFGAGGFGGRFWSAMPERGDTVVFRYPGSQDDWIKRVIGLPGDSVEMRAGTLWLNGREVPRVRIADYVMKISANSPCRTAAVEDARIVEGEDGEPACAYPRYRETLPSGRSYEIIDQGIGPADTTPRVRVPAGHLFVMGDNRDDSEDSRYARAEGGVALLPADQLIGRALITFFSTDGSAEWAKPWTWPSATRWDRIGDTFR